MVYVYDGNVDISTFLVDKQGGCYDYISCGTPEAPTDEDVFCLLDILEDIFFPLLENPGKELKRSFLIFGIDRRHFTQGEPRGSPLYVFSKPVQRRITNHEKR